VGLKEFIMKRLLLVLLLFIMIGCGSYTRYYPFIDYFQLKQILVGQNQDTVEDILGPPLMEININDNSKIWEYYYRHPNNLVSLPPKFFQNIIPPNEKIGIDDETVYSGKTDHHIFLTFRKNILLEIKLDGEVIGKSSILK